MSKPGTPKKAPKVAIPSKKRPNVMKEFDNKVKRKSPMQPMKSKRLSK